MPKMKSKRTLRHRFRLTATGKLTRAHANRRHLLSHRTHKRKRHLGRPDLVAPAEARTIDRLLSH